jgi:predicted nucleotidyltransferase
MERDGIKLVLQEILQRHAEELACAYLFGSYARGEEKQGSDVDLAILYRETPPATLEGLGLDIADALSARLKRKVDVVVLNSASPDLVHRVLRDGILVLETDRAARVRFEVKKRSEYFDVLPYLREYRRHAGLSDGRR